MFTIDKNRVSDVTPETITLLFKEACDTFPPIKEKPTDNNLQSIYEKITPHLDGDSL